MIKQYEKIKLQLQEENPDALLADGLDDALIGIARRVSQPSLAVYSVEKCIEILCCDMTAEEAEEYFQYNVIGTWLGENTPLFLESVYD